MFEYKPENGRKIEGPDWVAGRCSELEADG
jgi:hypothetical protein